MAVSHTDEKAHALRAAGALNPHAAAVTDAAFRTHPFFDARDLVQVKYEMLRRVQVDGQSVTQTTASFGFSRPVFYAAQTALARGGLPALVPQRPGPRRRHKLRPEILRFLQQVRSDEPIGSSWRPCRTRRDSLRRAFASAHHRAGVGTAPKIPGASTPPTSGRPSAPDRPSSYVRVSGPARAADPLGLITEYENLRARVVGDPVVGRPAHGLAVLLRSGVPAWLAQLQRSAIVVDHQPISHRDNHSPAGAPVGDVVTTILILASMVLAAQAEWTT